MRIGIVGHAAEKFVPETKAYAIRLIHQSLENGKAGNCLVSGRSPMGGVDVWAESIAKALNIPTLIFPPRENRWDVEGGFRDRNLKIAETSDVVHVIVVRDYPPGFAGMRFTGCYHCKDLRPPHVKSGACWTAMKAQGMGKKAEWHIL